MYIANEKFRPKTGNVLILLVAAIMVLISGCSKKQPLIDDKLSQDEIDKVIVYMPGGKPELKRASKTIVDKDEISIFVDVFNQAYYEGEAEEYYYLDDSVYQFWSNDKLVKTIFFNGYDCKYVLVNDDLFYNCYFDDITPIEVYNKSSAPTQFVVAKIDRIT